MINGGRFDFDDGGTYCGGWEDGKAHGHGVCTGPKGQGEYSGAWHYGFEVSGVYTWPSGNSYEGQWQNGKRHGLGAERRGRWVYRGEWTQGYKGRYGIRQSTNSQARYEGTWANGLQDGYGTETYADGGTYQGQWLRGMRHGYGVRRSAPYNVAAKYRSRSHAHASLTSLRSDQGDEAVVTPTAAAGQDKDKKTDDSRGGFVLRARSEPPARRRSLSERSVAVKRTILQGLRIKKQRSTGDISQRIGSGTGSIRSSGSTGSCGSDESAMTGGSGHDHGSFIGAEEFVDPTAVETYMGEWKNDKRSGFGVCERSDGLKYEGEWFNNKKTGYGITTLKDGTKEEGKCKGNILITSQRKKNMLFVRSSKLRERIDSAVSAATRAAQIAVQKADIAVSRSTTSKDRGEQADLAALQAREDSDVARLCAKQFAPDFHQPGVELLKKRHRDEHQMGNHVGTPVSTTPMKMGELPPPPLSASKVAAMNYAAENSNTPNAINSTSTPMFTTPNDEHQPQQQIIDQAARRQQLVLGRRLQPSFETDTPPHGMHNDSSAIPGGGGGSFDEPPQHYPSNNIHARQQQQQQLHPQQQHAHFQQIQRQQAMDSTTIMNQQQQRMMNNPSDSASYAMPHSSSVLVGGSTTTGPQHHYPPSQQHQRQEMGGGGGGQQNASPAISRTPSQSSSRYSLNQIINDHFDQYTMAANPNAAKLMQANMVRQTQPSPTDGGGGSLSAALTRRSTLASSRDWRALLSGTFDAVPERTSYGGALLTPTNNGGEGHHTNSSSTSSAQHRLNNSSSSSPSSPPQAPVVSTTTTSKFGDETDEETTVLNQRPNALRLAAANRREYNECRGSMPDITELDKSPIRLLPREEIARMSSQRRQELQRMQEEAELLRSNPFRYLRYLYHPSVRAWVIRWKLPILILLVNVALSFVFYRLLTYSNDEGDDDGDTRDDHQS